MPAFIIHGDGDEVVPLEENSAAVLERHQNAGAGGLMELTIAEGQGHNFWPGFFRCDELIEFAIKRAKAGSLR